MPRPTIEATTFGSITIDGTTYEHDVVIRTDGGVVKRKKKLSKQVYGTSHKVSREEAEFLWEKGCRRMIIGSGRHDSVRLSGKAEKYLAKRGCEVETCPTPEAADLFNAAPEDTAAMFHVTC